MILHGDDIKWFKDTTSKLTANSFPVYDGEHLFTNNYTFNKRIHLSFHGGIFFWCVRHCSWHNNSRIIWLTFELQMLYLPIMNDFTICPTVSTRKASFVINKKKKLNVVYFLQIFVRTILPNSINIYKFILNRLACIFKF